MRELNFLVGSAIKIEAKLNINTATCTCTVKNASGQTKIDDASMTKIVNGVYQYIYQSALTDDYGEYTAVVKIVSDSGTAYEKIIFTLDEQP